MGKSAILQYDEECQLKQHDFFLPTSKKCKPQKRIESPVQVVSKHLEVSKGDNSSLRTRRAREAKNIPAAKGIISTITKQGSKDEPQKRIESPVRVVSKHLEVTKGDNSSLRTRRAREEKNIPAAKGIISTITKQGSKDEPQKRIESPARVVSKHLEVSKGDSSSLRTRRAREEKDIPAAKGISSTITKQGSKDEDFFKPVSKKQKQILRKHVKVQNHEAVLHSDGCTNTHDDNKNVGFHFDLRMEAKLAAEENVQLCGGKPTHPFFVQHKAGQRSFSAVSTLDSSTLPEVDELVPSPPCHVTQSVEMDAKQIDWQNLNFRDITDSEKTEPSCLKAECLGLSLWELHLPKRRSEVLRRQKPCRQTVNDVLEPLAKFLRENVRGDNSDGKANTNKYEIASLLTNLQGRLSSQHSDSARALSSGLTGPQSVSYSMKNSLWTDLYQPQSPEQVCGNKDTVASLNAWLQSWQTKCVSSATSLQGGNTQKKDGCSHDPDDGDWFEMDNDRDGDLNEDDVLHNVLFLAGPVGCGKTAAIQACARMQGYTVIEVNCSDNRSGAVIKNKFSEAMESHRLIKWSADSVSCQGVHKQDKSCDAEKVKSGLNLITNSKPNSESNGGVTLATTAKQPLLEAANDQPTESESKTLTVMLFEDVDMVFEDDRGFMAAVTQLAGTTKRPIILTSNVKELSLPHDLSSNLLEFKRPSTEELVATAYMVCITQGFTCNPEFLHEVVMACCHDIRRTINFLQFWCQGLCLPLTDTQFDFADTAKADENTTSGKNINRFPDIDSTTAIVLFKLEAQHRLWPALIPLQFPCEFTQSVASRLSVKSVEFEKKICDAEVKASQLKVLEAEEKQASLLKKKKRRVRQCKCTKSDNVDEKEGVSASDLISGDENECLQTPVKNLKEVKTVARSPILRRRIRRELAMVMSDSDEEGPLENKEGSLQQDSLATANTLNDEMVSVDGKINECMKSHVSTDRNSVTATGADLCFQQDSQISNVVDEESRIMAEDVDVGSQGCVDVERMVLISTESQNLFDCPNEVDVLWSDLKKHKEHSEFVIDPTSKDSLSAVISLSKLTDDISACDTMSSMHHCPKTMKQDLGQALHHVGDEHSEGLQMCGQIAHISLQMCITDCASYKSLDETGMPVSPNDMMLAVSDACTLGKLGTDGETCLPAYLKCNVGPFSADQDSERFRKQSAVHNSLTSSLPMKAQRAFRGTSFHEYVSFLARIEQLGQQARLDSGLTRRRGRSMQHYLSIYPWELSEESLTILHAMGSFGGT